MKNSKTILVYLLLFIYSIVLIYFSQNHCFFWDNRSQVSVPAHWFFQHGFSTLFLPDAIATGHPTTFGLYIALAWKCFGQSLQVAHWAMLPFLFGLLVQLYLLIKKYISQNLLLLSGLLFVATDACLFSQSTLVTFEIPHAFLLLLAINSLLKQNKKLCTLAILGLCIISLRGLLSCLGLLVFELFTYRKQLIHFFTKNFILYTPGLLAITAYLLVHYLQRGWLVHNTVSGAWEQSAQIATPKIMVKNCVILFVRLFEYGRIALFPLLIFIVWKWKILVNNHNLKLLAIILIGQALVFFPTVIVYQNSFSTRYFLPVIIIMIIITIIFLNNYIKKAFQFILILILLNVGGWFVVYPVRFAMPWDCTPAHLPYYNLRNSLFNYLETKQIPTDNLSGGFNFFGDINTMDMVHHGFIKQEPENKYYILSNISNPTDQTLQVLSDTTQWKIEKRFKKCGVFIELYKKN